MNTPHCCYIDLLGNHCPRPAVYTAVFGNTPDAYTQGCEQHIYSLVPDVKHPEEVWIVPVGSEWPWSKAVPIVIDEKEK